MAQLFFNLPTSITGSTFVYTAAVSFSNYAMIKLNELGVDKVDSEEASNLGEIINISLAIVKSVALSSNGKGYFFSPNFVQLIDKFVDALSTVKSIIVQSDNDGNNDDLLDVDDVDACVCILRNLVLGQPLSMASLTHYLDFLSLNVPHRNAVRIFLQYNHVEFYDQFPNSRLSNLIADKLASIKSGVTKSLLSTFSTTKLSEAFGSASRICCLQLKPAFCELSDVISSTCEEKSGSPEDIYVKWLRKDLSDLIALKTKNVDDAKCDDILKVVLELISN